MLRSMTGFGAAASEEGGVAVRAEVRSVNHRYLQVKTRVPSELVHLEPEIETALKKRVARGSVTVHVNAETPKGAQPATIDEELAQRYKRSLEGLARALGLAEQPSLAHILALPGVVLVEAPGGILRAHAAHVLSVVRAAIDKMVEMREAEGRALEADLRRNATATARTLGAVEKRMPTVVKNMHRGLVKRLDELLEGRQSVRHVDVAREIALIADRADVAEEIARLRSHLEQLGGMLDKDGASGRKLDFLVQEMFREVNTIGSKCADARVAHQVVEMKTRVERLREQVQNVE